MKWPPLVLGVPLLLLLLLLLSLPLQVLLGPAFLRAQQRCPPLFPSHPEH